MTWWNAILGALKQEFELGTAKELSEPTSAKQAEALLKRTVRELATARARCEAARRRMKRAQEELDQVASQAKGTPDYRDRLSELAKSVAHESDLLSAFERHSETLAQLQARIEHERARFERDLNMERDARVAAAALKVGTRSPETKPSTADQAAGFRHQNSQQSALLQQLKHRPERLQDDSPDPSKGGGAPGNSPKASKRRRP
jgi:hypothetical protein